MKTAISLPDPLFDEAEELASRLGKSRSQLYADALREYIFRHDDERVTAELDRVLADASEPELDRFVGRAGSQILRSTEWE